MIFAALIVTALQSPIACAMKDRITRYWVIATAVGLYLFAGYQLLTSPDPLNYRVELGFEHPTGAAYALTFVALLASQAIINLRLYIMAFKDSFNKWEPIGGYGWEKTWRPLADENFHMGLGFTAGATARDNWKYIPVPVLLPLASIGYGPATFQMTYIPGTYNNGNVYFAWMRFQF